MSDDDYQKMRQQQIDWLEHHYDLSTESGIKAIPEIKNPPRSPIGGPMDVTGDIDYYLRLKASTYEKTGRIDLAILCLKKSNAIRRLGRVPYRKSDFYTLVRMLARNGMTDEALQEKNRIDQYYALMDSPYIEDQEALDRSIEREIEHGKDICAFSWLQQNFPSLCPTSISGFRRMKKQNTKTFQMLSAEAAKLGRKI